MDTIQSTTPTPPPIDTTTPTQPPNYTTPEARALANKIINTHSPDALITLLSTLPPSHPIDYAKCLLDAASFRHNHPSKIEILFSRLVDITPPDQSTTIQKALLEALSAASRTLNVPGATLLLRLGADPWTDAAMADKEHPLLMAVGQTFPMYAGDKNGQVAVRAGVDPFLLEVMDRFADREEAKRLWRGEVRAIAVHLKEMVGEVLLRGVSQGTKGGEGFRRLMRLAQERFLVALRRMVVKGVVGMGVEGVLGDLTLKGDGRGWFGFEYEGVWWRRGLTPVGLRKRLREEGMLLEEGLVEVWGELVRVAGGVLVKGRKVEGEMELYVLLVEGKEGKYEGGKGKWDWFF